MGRERTYILPAALVVSCIGYRTPRIEGVPYDAKLGRFANDDGRMGPGLYAVGWARRGPTGTIGTNRPDGFMIAEHIAVGPARCRRQSGRIRARRTAGGARGGRRRLSRLAAHRTGGGRRGACREVHGRSSPASRRCWPREDQAPRNREAGRADGRPRRARPLAAQFAPSRPCRRPTASCASRLAALAGRRRHPIPDTSESLICSVWDPPLAGTRGWNGARRQRDGRSGRKR
jgi:hypothetical protein